MRVTSVRYAEAIVGYTGELPSVEKRRLEVVDKIPWCLGMVATLAGDASKGEFQADNFVNGQLNWDGAGSAAAAFLKFRE
jgi:hypothetical protein